MLLTSTFALSSPQRERPGLQAVHGDGDGSEAGSAGPAPWLQPVEPAGVPNPGSVGRGVRVLPHRRAGAKHRGDTLLSSGVGTQNSTEPFPHTTMKTKNLLSIHKGLYQLLIPVGAFLFSIIHSLCAGNCRRYFAIIIFHVAAGC